MKSVCKGFSLARQRLRFQEDGMTPKQWLFAVCAVVCLIALGIFLAKHPVEAKTPNSLTASYSEAAGNVIEERGELTRDNVFVVDKCEQTPDANLFNCYVVQNDAHHYATQVFSTKDLPRGTKAVIAKEHRGGEIRNELPLLESLDERQLAALGLK